MTAALIGLGNILLRDEGVGVHVVNAVKGRYDFSPELEIVDGGTMGLDLLPHFQVHDRILIVDAVDFGREPGYVMTVEDEAIPSVLNPKLSVHHIGLSDILLAARFVRESPVKTALVGIQPGSMDVGLDMTALIQDKMEQLIGLVVQKLEDWNFTCAVQSRHGSSG